MKYMTVIVFAVFAVLSGCTTERAAAPEESDVISVDDATVTVVLRSGKRIVGRLHQEESDEYVIQTESGYVRVPKDEITSLVPTKSEHHDPWETRDHNQQVDGTRP
jgi:hypothetical protein